MICSSLYGHRVVRECDVLRRRCLRRYSPALLGRDELERACDRVHSRGGAGSGDRPLLAPGATDFLRHATPAIAYALQRVRFAALGVTVARTAAKVPEALQLGPNLVKDKALGVVITGKI
jgi:hypothetical protein